jgi:hypothetical protein
MRFYLYLFASIVISFTAYGQGSKMSSKEMKEFMIKEANITNPDYSCFIPESFDFSTFDSENEHFLVFDGPDGSLMAIWTQHFNIDEMYSRLIFSKSLNKGKSWSIPKILIGPSSIKDTVNKCAEWGFPIVSNSGRIYVLWNQNQGIAGWIKFHTGTMAGMYSDDFGQTWSKPQAIPMPKSPFDDPSGKTPGEWIVWQKPERAPDGKHIVGYTHWINEAASFYNKKTIPKGGWTWIESVVEFMRFENIDENPEPKNIKINYTSWGDKALRVPHYIEPRLSIAQEPSIVDLPDGRLFCTMRTASGYIWYSLSNDNGKTWCNPRPLLRKDHGEPILQPVSCCPIYKLKDGKFILLHHNNRGNITIPGEIHSPRNPAYIALGEFRPNADQPIWFSDSGVFLDNKFRKRDGQPDTTKRSNVGTYTSFSTSNGENILWYPDRKCFLLGKKITNEFLEGLIVPGSGKP